MRFHSTPESVLNGEITILAIIECIVAIMLYVGVCFYLGSFRYLAWAVVGAPLMLFRTDRSVEWGLDLYSHFHNKIIDTLDRFIHISHANFVIFPFKTILITTMVALGGSAIRILSPMVLFARKPVEALSEAPINWQRQCLCTDFYFPPEIVPRESTETELELKFGNIMGFLRRKGSLGRGIWMFFLGPFLFLGFLPPLLYRISFKATSIAYMPFIWVVHWTLVKTLSVKAQLERFIKGEREKVRRVISWTILASLMAKIALNRGWIDLTFLAAKFPNQKIMEYFVVPSHWPWWQFTLVSDAVLTFFLFFFADAALARHEEGAWSGETILTTISVTSFIRAMCGLLTMSHFFYIALISVVPQTPKHLFP